MLWVFITGESLQKLKKNIETNCVFFKPCFTYSYAYAAWFSVYVCVCVCVCWDVNMLVFRKTGAIIQQKVKFCNPLSKYYLLGASPSPLIHRHPWTGKGLVSPPPNFQTMYSTCVNPFVPSAPFLYSLRRFSDVFRG